MERVGQTRPRTMATCNLLRFTSVCFGLAHWLGLSWCVLAAVPAPSNPTASNLPQSSQAIPWSQLGAKAGADYRGDGLAVMSTAEGVRLRCVFQRLEGEATREGFVAHFDRHQRGI